jgi:5-(carboxyamino)imidazole ribonucleotide synthase
VHLYGKKEAVVKRKMGHVNVLAENTDAALSWIEETTIWKV